MLLQIETSHPLSEEQPHRHEPKAPEPDDYDTLLDKLMVSEGCPNVRDDD